MSKGKALVAGTILLTIAFGVCLVFYLYKNLPIRPGSLYFFLFIIAPLSLCLLAVAYGVVLERRLIGKFSECLDRLDTLVDQNERLIRLVEESIAKRRPTNDSS